ncbi:MAG: putative metal-binding motif-containing protein [Myxococcota bacterium]
MRCCLLVLLIACNGTSTSSDVSDGTDAPGPVDFDQDGSFSDVDCDDNDFEVFPGADEYCDDKDNDCDGEIDEDAVNAELYYSDNDRDGYGSEGGSPSCNQPPDTADRAGDCDDQNSAINPDATEVCDDNNVDEDCDGDADDADDSVDSDSKTAFFIDADGDGFGLSGSEVLACDLGPGRSDMDGDCDDTDAELNPDLGCGFDWDGTWLGTVQLEVSIPDIGSRERCKFEILFEVDASRRDQIRSVKPGSCAIEALSGRGEVSLQATFLDETHTLGNYTLAGALIPFEGTFADGPPTFSEKGTDTVFFGKYKSSVTHSMTATRTD